MTCGFAFGPTLTREGVTFRLWAPAARNVQLLLDRPLSMERVDEGWFSLFVPKATEGTRYRFQIDDEPAVPDPASAFQPDDVFGPSEVIDFDRYFWSHTTWRGRPWEEAVICEMHVGAFTAEGTFQAAIGKLDHLAEAGYTAIELMPIADFVGRWNWGYDGVLLYAPDHSYGRPEDLMALVDAAHSRGLMVFLDVVYNHFGPEGNFLGGYAPAFFTERHHTPWGAAIDYAVPQVREFAIGNALHWLKRYRFDGLRLDAVHAIVEPGEPHILTEMSRRAGDLTRENGRLIHLVLENDDNNASALDPEKIVPAGRYRAQWNDDYHHAWHVLLTRETQGYYCDYADAAKHLARTLSSGFAYQGEPSPHRNMVPRGASSAHLPPAAFVNFIQNHDQVGNRALGDRLSATVAANAQRAALTVTLLAPMPVLMFMGEEWGTQRPFPFFCDFHGQLAEAVREGRKREFAAAYADIGEPVPDPLSQETFLSAKLDWDALLTPHHADWLGFVRHLLSIRRKERIARFCHSVARSVELDGAIISARWSSSGSRKLWLLINTDALPATPKLSLRPQGRPIWGGTLPEILPSWSVYWSIAED